VRLNLDATSRSTLQRSLTPEAMDHAPSRREPSLEEREGAVSEEPMLERGRGAGLARRHDPAQPVLVLQDVARGDPLGGHALHPLPAFAPGTSRTCCMSAASRSAMRRCGTGGAGSGQCLRPRSGSGGSAACARRAGAGTWMRSLSASMACSTTSGAPLITKERYWRP
jgi:hypothetical protein